MKLFYASHAPLSTPRAAAGGGGRFDFWLALRATLGCTCCGFRLPWPPSAGPCASRMRSSTSRVRGS